MGVASRRLCDRVLLEEARKAWAGLPGGRPFDGKEAEACIAHREAQEPSIVRFLAAP